MANEQLIDTVIAPAAGEQITNLQKILADLDIQMTANIKSANALNAATSNARSFSDYTKNATAAALAAERIAQAQNKTAVTTARLNTELARQATVENQTAISANRLTTSNNTLAASQARTAAATQRTAGEYARLLAAYNTATLVARNAGVQHGVTSQQFLTEAANVQMLRRQLDAVDQPLGNFQRNVGNYGNAITGAFSKAFGVIRTLAYILPGIGIAGIFSLLGEGIMKIANYYGLFSTKIGQATANLNAWNEVSKTANKEAGEQSSNLKILYVAATDVNNSMKDRLLAVHELKKEFPDTFKNIKVETILNGGATDSYNELTKSIVKNAQARAAANKIAELSGQLLDIEFTKEKIANAKANETANDIISFRKRIVDLYTEQAKNKGLPAPTKNEIDDIIKRFYSNPGGNDVKISIDRRAKDALALADQNKKIIAGQIKFLTDFAGGNNALAKGLSKNDTPTDAKPDRKGILNDRLKEEKDNLDQILLLDFISYEDRLDTISNFQKASNAIIRGGLREKVITELESRNLLTGIDNDTTKIRLKTVKDAEKELADALKEGLKLQESVEATSIEALQEAGDQKLLILSEQQSKAELLLTQQYAKGLMSERAYNMAKLKIDDEAAEAAIKQEIVTQQAIIDVRKALLEFGIGSERDLLKAQEKLGQLRISLNKATSKTILDGFKDEIEANKQRAELEKQIAYEAQDFIQSAIDATFQKRLQQIDLEKKALDDQAKSEIEQVNRSIASQSTKAREIGLINAQSADKQKQLDAESAKVKTQQAKFDRAVSIAKVVESTAVADIKAFADFPFPIAVGIAALITALGALQIAKIVSVPLPKYAKGTKNHPGGLALWGEAGTELKTLPDGTRHVSTGPTVEYMPKGTVITPHMELMQMIKPNTSRYTGGQEIGWKEVIKAIERNKPEKQRNLIRVNVDGSYEQYKRSYLRR